MILKVFDRIFLQEIITFKRKILCFRSFYLFKSRIYLNLKLIKMMVVVVFQYIQNRHDLRFIIFYYIILHFISFPN